MKLDQFDIKGTKVGSVTVSEDVFGAEINTSLVTQYVHVHRKRRALGTKKTKGRGEVSGGGRKPWRQKGTGRARHGSIRSPLWVGGGHAHPISPRMNTRVRMSKKMRNGALISVLSLRMQEGGLISIKDLGLGTPRTKDMIAVLDTLKLSGKKVLVVTPEKDIVVEKSVSNIPGVEVVEARLLSPIAVLKFPTLLLVGSATEVIEERIQLRTTSNEKDTN